MWRENPFKVKLIRYQIYDDELIPILIDERYFEFIEPVATQWSWDLWHRYKLNTVTSCMRDVALFYWWHDIEGINITDRIYELKLYTKDELHNLVTFLSTSKKPSKDGSSEAHRSTFNRRLYSISKFISELAFERLSVVRCATKYDRSRKKIDSVRSYLNKCFYTNSADLSARSKCLNLEEIETLQQVISPNSYFNPFKQELIQWRNCTIINTLLETGIRRGELVRLKVEDLELDTQSPTISIRVNHGCEDYPRKEKPSVKTKGRTLPISRALQNLYIEYLNEIRPKLDSYRTTRYVFLSTKDGKALGTSGVYQLLKRIEKEYPIFVGKLKPHDLRVTSHTNIRKALENAPISENTLIQQGNLKDVMTYVGGWSSQSTMVRRYTEKAIADRLNGLVHLIDESDE